MEVYVLQRFGCFISEVGVVYTGRQVSFNEFLKYFSLSNTKLKFTEIYKFQVCAQYKRDPNFVLLFLNNFIQYHRGITKKDVLLFFQSGKGVLYVSCTCWFQSEFLSYNFIFTKQFSLLYCLLFYSMYLRYL